MGSFPGADPVPGLVEQPLVVRRTEFPACVRCEASQQRRIGVVDGEVLPLIESELKYAVKLSVPIKVGISVADRWGGLK